MLQISERDAAADLPKMFVNQRIYSVYLRIDPLNDHLWSGKLLRQLAYFDAQALIMCSFALEDAVGDHTLAKSP